jgi:tetratricopeptide (TPR) repeat protein
MSGRARASAAALGAIMLGTAAMSAAPRRLRGSEGLARAYDAILDARFEQADGELARACSPPPRREPLRRGEGPAPSEACAVLRATALWWRILLDPQNPSLDPPFVDAVERAIASAEAWTARAPQDPEAWFYLGGAYGARVQWRVLRDEKLAAARDGKRIKQALERTIALDPELNDAYFGIGLYKYYAEVAPAAVRFLRWLLLLPGGDRVEGLDEMLRARRRGELMQGEADYQLHLIYLWYEQKPDRALALLEGLRERYPSNPLFALHIADVQDVYFHDVPAAMAAFRAALASAREQKVAFPKLAEARARLGLARHLDTLGETDRSIDHLRAVVDAKPEAPFGVVGQAHVMLGAAYDRLGQRSQAVAAFDAAIVAAPSGDPHGVRRRAATGLRRRPDPRVTDAYRMSLEGWRAYERGDTAAAAALLARALDLTPGDFIARYRYGRVLSARQEDARAVGELERALAARAAAPPSLVAAAFLEAGRVHERSGRRDRAEAAYRHASHVFGSGAEMRATRIFLTFFLLCA